MPIFIFQSHIGAIRILAPAAIPLHLFRFQSHIGAIRMRRRLFMWQQNFLISIPHWCNQNLLSELIVTRMLEISIPHWCNQNLSISWMKTQMTSIISIPHWCNQNQLLNLMSIWNCANFNPTLVQLELREKIEISKINVYFNPTLVQLESSSEANASALSGNFNPTLVQLEYTSRLIINRLQIISIPHWCNQNGYICDDKFARKVRFQSHIGAIRIRSFSLTHTRKRYNFNPTLVQLEFIENA